MKCTIAINNGSGTYRPDPKFLMGVANLFAKQTGYAPDYVWNSGAKTMLPTGLKATKTLNCR